MQQLNSEEILSHQHNTQLRKKGRLRDKKTSKKKRFWTEAEDRILQSGVRRFGNKKWSEISKLLKNRHPKRCRERWFNYLTEKNKIWTSYDLWLLFLAFKLHGNKWCQISKILERGDNIVKNKIICLKRKGLNEFQERLKQTIENQTLDNSLPGVEYKLLQKLIDIEARTQKNRKMDREQVQRKHRQENENYEPIARQNYGQLMDNCISAQTYQIQYPYYSYCPTMMYYVVPFSMGEFS